MTSNKPRVNDTLFELAPADGIAVDARTGGAPSENTEVQHEAKR